MRLLVFVIGIAIIGVGCGGGGGKAIKAEPASEPPSTTTKPPATKPPPKPPSKLDLQKYSAISEFQNQPALAQVKAHYAYARGATGAGIKIGMIDTAIDDSHPELWGKVLSSSRNAPGYSPDFSSCPSRNVSGECVSEEPLWHGSLVGGVMVANREIARTDSLSMHGIAFDATLLSIGIPLGDGSGTYRPLDLTTVGSSTDEELAGYFNELNPEVRVINSSWGVQGLVDRYTEAAIRNTFPKTIEAFAQAGTSPAGRTIHVWAAGNDNGKDTPTGLLNASSPAILSGLAVRIPELRGHTLAVVAVDNSGDIASFSNRCGIAEEFCLAAPGVAVIGPVPNILCGPGTTRCYGSSSGTSLAAPLVSGGIALLAQYYRGQLGNDEVVRRMLETANKSGKYAQSTIYGQGLLDLDAATQPVGGTRMLTGHSLTGPSYPESLSALSLGAGFGDAFSRELANLEVAAFDQLDAPFFRPLSHYIQPSAFTDVSLEDRFRALGNDPRGQSWETGGVKLRMRFDGYRPGAFSLARRAGNNEIFLGLRNHPGWYFGLHATGQRTGSTAGLIGTFTDDSAFANPFLSFARNGAVAGVSKTLGKGEFSIAAFYGTGQDDDRLNTDHDRAIGMLTEYRLADTTSTRVSVQAGWMKEPSRLIGSRPIGAFGDLGTGTGFMGISARRWVTDRWTALASAYAGLSHAEIQNPGILHDVSALRSSAFSVGLVGDSIIRTRDRLAIRLAQPLRVESGNMDVRWVSGRTRDRQARVETATLDLEPSSRQLDLELTWARPWKEGHVHMAALTSRNAGHARSEDDMALLIRYKRNF